MSDRLTEEELADIEQRVPVTKFWWHRRIRSMLAEIRAHRAAALTEEERAVLLNIRRHFDDAAFVKWGPRALATLDKLLGKGAA